MPVPERLSAWIPNNSQPQKTLDLKGGESMACFFIKIVCVPQPSVDNLIVKEQRF